MVSVWVRLRGNVETGLALTNPITVSSLGTCPAVFAGVDGALALGPCRMLLASMVAVGVLFVRDWKSFCILTGGSGR